MERVVTRTSKSRLVTIMPASDGWRVGGVVDGESARPVRTMEEAAAAVPDGAIVRLSLPVNAVLMERMRLPSTDREELGGMVVLQLEKSMPYTGDEVTSGFEIIRQEANESELLAIAVSNEQLDNLCEPLRASRRLPDEVSVFAVQLSARFPDEETLALIFRESDSTILAIAQKGKLVAAQTFLTTDREEFLTELPRLLLAAELEGSPVNFTRIAIERELSGWVDGLREHFGKTPVDRVAMDGPLEPGPVNLVPAGWTLELEQTARKARLRDWLAFAGLVYLLLLLMAAGYIIWMQRRMSAVDAKVVAAEPTVDAIAEHKARWSALASAMDPTLYPVEVLLQAYKSIPPTAPGASPDSDLHITVFNQTPSQITVEGEAPNGNLAVQYQAALQANLKLFHFDPPAYENLPNEHVHFRIFGKL